MLIAVTILATEKHIPGNPVPTEEILVPTKEVSAPDNNVALILVAAQNADTINKVAQTHTFKAVVRLLG